MKINKLSFVAAVLAAIMTVFAGCYKIYIIEYAGNDASNNTD